MLTLILFIAIAGLVVGALARLLVPGPDPMGILGTILLGIVGSVVGGLLFDLLFRKGNGQHVGGVGLIGSVIGAVLCLLVFRAATGGGHRTRSYR
jgi:uncharacterized membrane protein YeaQ/YmgE (transglycosylase-associated protein family)